MALRQCNLSRRFGIIVFPKCPFIIDGRRNDSFRDTRTPPYSMKRVCDLLWRVVRDQADARKQEGRRYPWSPLKSPGTRCGAGCECSLEERIVALEREPWGRVSKRELPSEVKGHCDPGFGIGLPRSEGGGQLSTVARQRWTLGLCRSFASTRTPKRTTDRTKVEKKVHSKRSSTVPLALTWNFYGSAIDLTLPHRRLLLMTRIRIPAPFAELAKVPDTAENDTKLGSSIRG